jgi:hypothetical protein
MLRANIQKSRLVQFNGLEELNKNWLYVISQNSDISAMPISSVVMEVPNAYTT